MSLSVHSRPQRTLGAVTAPATLEPEPLFPSAYFLEWMPCCKRFTWRVWDLLPYDREPCPFCGKWLNEPDPPVSEGKLQGTHTHTPLAAGRRAA